MKKFAGALIPLIVGALISCPTSGSYPAKSWEVSTLAGSAVGFRDGLGRSAQFNTPSGVAVDAAGNVYVADYDNDRVRKITPEGLVSTLAGSTEGFRDGLGRSAEFNGPAGVAVDAAGNVYVADEYNHLIRKITPEGLVSTLAGSTEGFRDGSGRSAQFSYPVGVAVDAAGNVYVADYGNHLIRKITPEGLVSTLAGSTEGFRDGAGTSAEFNGPTGVAVDAAGNVYVADTGNHLIRKITPEGLVSTLAGSTEGFRDGLGTSAEFSYPIGVAVDAEGNVYVADYGNHLIRKVTPEGLVSTLAGSTEGFRDGSGTSAEFSYPIDVAVDAAGNVYVADGDNNLIRKITPEGLVSTLAGRIWGFRDGSGTSAEFNYPIGVAVDAEGNVYVANSYNHRIRKITDEGLVSTLAGSIWGFRDGAGRSAQFNYPYGVAVDAAGNVYVADTNNHAIRKITPEGLVSTLAGSTEGSADGAGTSAQFNSPTDVAVDAAGNVYVADYLNDRIRKITPEGLVSTLAGSTEGFRDGAGTSAQFNSPAGVAVDAAGNVYVADYLNDRIRKITPEGVVSTLAGSTEGFRDGLGRSAQFNGPAGVAVDAAGNVYVADEYNHRIRKITPEGVVSTLAGSTEGFRDGIGRSAQFDKPSGVAVDAEGNVYVADSDNHRIRRIEWEMP